MPEFFKVDLSEFPLPDDTDLVVPIQLVLNHVRLISELDSARTVSQDGFRHYNIIVEGNQASLDLYNDTKEKAKVNFWSILSYTLLRPEESVLHEDVAHEDLQSPLGHIQLEELSAFGIKDIHLEPECLQPWYPRTGLVAQVFVRPSPNTRFVNKAAQRIRLFQVRRVNELYHRSQNCPKPQQAPKQPSSPQTSSE